MMISFINNLPIKYKLILIIMASVVVSLSLMSTAIIISERYLAKQSMTERLLTVNRIIADRSTAALSFDDHRAARENLLALNQESTVILGCIYNKNNTLFASYNKFTQTDVCPGSSRNSGYFFSNGSFEATQDIILDGERIGAVYIRSSLKELYEREILFLYLIISIVLLAGLVTYFIALKLQTIISGPILELTEIAEKISNKTDYTINIPKASNDEIGTLNRAFKNMIQQIQKREKARDIAQQELIDKEKNLEITLHSIADAVITTNDVANVTRMNIVAEKLTGWTFSDAKGLPVETVFSIIDSNSKEKIQSPIEKVLATGEIIYLEKDTTLISKTGSAYSIANTASGAPINDEDGIIQGAILVFSDATQQHQTEKALRRSQKMDAIGQLSGGIAHDFNNRLGIILGYLDMLKNHVADDELPTKWVDTALNATLRCSDLTRQLLGFSRQNIEQKKTVNIKDEFNELKNMILRSVTPEIDVQMSFDDDIWSVETDPGELHDALLNMSINARDAMLGGGKFVIEVSNIQLDRDYTNLNPGVVVGDYVQIVLSDSGIGMDKKTIEHIFEPFFTTKPKGKGTGLGMAMVYGFAKRYGGHVKIYSEINVGTTIRLYLPRSKNSITSIKSDEHDLFPTGTESILIVDDEFELLQLAAQFLGELNYTFYTAENANQALIILKGNLNIDLLFTDLVMPGGVTGYELAELALAIKPDLKVLLTSGFTSKSTMINRNSKISNEMLNKPYRKFELANRIRQVLDASIISNNNETELEKHYTILLVEEKSDINDVHKQKLSNLGCEIISVNNGFEAIETYQLTNDNNKIIDATIIDLTLCNGLSCDELKEKLRLIDSNVKIITFYNENTDLTDFNQLDYDGVINSDFNENAIIEVFEAVFNKN